MKHFNWLVQSVFYRHTEKKASATDFLGKEKSIFYPITYMNQQHANLCLEASESMLYHFADRPIATMAVNPRAIFEGASIDQVDKKDFTEKTLNIEQEAIIKQLSENGPFIYALSLKYDIEHQVVAVGFVNNQLIYHDPLTGPNRLICLDDLVNLNENRPNVEIFEPTFITEAHRTKDAATFIPPEIFSVPTRHACFFQIRKIPQTDCEAIKNFLADYAKPSIWNICKKHKKTVNEFLVQHKDTNDLHVLLKDLSNLEKTAKSTKKELYRRVKTIEKIFPTPKNWAQESMDSLGCKCY